MVMHGLYANESSHWNYDISYKGKHIVAYAYTIYIWTYKSVVVSKLLVAKAIGENLIVNSFGVDTNWLWWHDYLFGTVQILNETRHAHHSSQLNLNIFLVWYKLLVSNYCCWTKSVHWKPSTVVTIIYQDDSSLLTRAMRESERKNVSIFSTF